MSVNEKQETSNGNGHLEGRYANYFKVGWNAFEFVIDFGQLYSDLEWISSCARIVTAPVYAKALLETLKKSIDDYEQACGAIQVGEERTQHGRL